MSEKTKTVKVKFLKSHHHAGMQYSEGAEIDVPEHDANWLKNLKIADDAKPSTAVTTPKTVEEK
ncbi:DUF7210 family protein [Acinetobacter junii]|uniref:DUF7210 family protein n=1 Tax=Acinetobacter junii TaxID=40215 RepID=UPI00124FAFB8|nr:hypothetical protein [Acinetobacter junii]